MRPWWTMRSMTAAAMSSSPNTSPHLPDSRFEADTHASGLVAVGYDLEQEARAFDVDGQVAQFVDDQQFCLADCLELGVEAVVVFGLAQAHDQGRGREEPDRYHAPAGQFPDRDGQVRLAASDVAVEHEVLGPVHELEAGELFASPVGGERGHAPGRIRRVSWIAGSRPAGAGGRVWIRPCWRSPSPDRPARKPSCPGVASSHARRSTSRAGGSVRASSMTCPGVAFGDRRLPVGAVVAGISVVVVSVIVPPCICRIRPGPGRRACHRLAGCVPRWSRWSPGRQCARP